MGGVVGNMGLGGLFSQLRSALICPQSIAVVIGK